MPKRRPDHVPTRTCAVCRTSRPKREMTRIVRAADGSIAPRRHRAAAGPGNLHLQRPELPRPGAGRGGHQAGARSRARCRSARVRGEACRRVDTAHAEGRVRSDKRTGPRPGSVATETRARSVRLGRSSCRTRWSIKDFAETLDGQPRGDHQRPDPQRHLRDHQPVDRLRHRLARRRRARLRDGRARRGRASRRGRGQPEQELVAPGAGAERAGGADDLDRGRPVEARRARADRDRHGPRRPRQDEPPRRDPRDEGRLRRERRHHPAHRRQRGRPQRQAHRLPRHARPRGLLGHARPRRPGDRHRDHRRGSR